MDTATQHVDLDTFRKETRAWLEANCPASQRLPAPKGWDELFAGGRKQHFHSCLLYTSPSPRDRQKSRMPSSA